MQIQAFVVLGLILLFSDNVSSSPLVPFSEFDTHSLYLAGPAHHVAKRDLLEPIPRPFPDMPEPGRLTIANFNVQSDIRYRYSSTYFTSTVINDGYASNEVSFHVILPETGFISKFIMEIDGQTYEAYVKEKEVAKDIYNKAQARGQTAGLVELNSRFSNVFNVNVNVRSRSSVTFNLTYEELLQRRLGHYEQIISISPNQGYTVDNLRILVTIEESNKIKNIVVPKLKFDDLEYGSEDLAASNPGAEIAVPSSNRARIIWRPGKYDLDELNRKGAIGKFIVRYELVQESGAGEVLVMNGYFVHFFSPPNLRPLPKHVIFVLDYSGSMLGRKIEQLKQAMKKILRDLKPDDYFNVLIFSDSVTHWTPEYRPMDVQRSYIQPWYRRRWNSWRRPIYDTPIQSYPQYIQPYPASQYNIQKAEEFVLTLPANGGTNINDALMQAIRVTSSLSSRHEQLLSGSTQSMILFLTDGEPTVGTTSLPEIERNVRNSNEAAGTPIFSLAFGREADFPFIKRVSLQNHGFARKIYEAADANLQLEGFYKEISSPLLRNVQFKYSDDEIDGLTTIHFGTYFDGSEIITAGRMRSKYEGDHQVRPAAGSGVSSKQASPFAPTSISGSNADMMIRCYDCDPCPFPVEIHGCGINDACTVWKRPAIYSYRWHPWHCWHPPPLPTTTTMRPQTKEDAFLERFWAYLTIKQLIDRDFAGWEGGSSARSRALELALKYGFVTSLTSLVVVKPDEPVYIAEPVPIDYFNNGGGRILPGGAGGFAGGFMRKAMNHMSGASAGMMDADFASRPMRADGSGGAAKSDKGKDSFYPSSPPWIPTATTTRTPRKTDSSLYYGLNDIKWLQMQMGSPLSIKIERSSLKVKIYQVETGDTNSIGLELKKSSCVIEDGGIRHSGQCVHLKDCVQQEFINDFEQYERSYFCEAKTKVKNKMSYAGACCQM